MAAAPAPTASPVATAWWAEQLPHERRPRANPASAADTGAIADATAATGSAMRASTMAEIVGG